jgi:hypothetical protein
MLRIDPPDDSDVLTRLAATPISQLDQFLPDRWQSARQSATVTG